MSSDSDYSDFIHDALLGAMIRTLSNGPEEWQCVQPSLVAAGIGLWQQRMNLVLSPSGGWYSLFNIPPGKIFLLEDYLALIDDLEERERVGKIRKKFPWKPSMAMWQDKFSLAWRIVHSKVLIVREEMLIGVDMVVPEA